MIIEELEIKVKLKVILFGNLKLFSFPNILVIYKKLDRKICVNL